MSQLRLHGYWRSTASWRVRLALGLKGIRAVGVFHHLRRGGQRTPAFLALNPQGLVPALEAGGDVVLTQSVAIIEWLEETWSEPLLLPANPVARAHVRGFALAIACDIHPLQNLGVLQRLRGLGIDEAQVTGWARSVIGDGLAACATLLADGATPFCFGEAPGLADICLIPQLYNARRFGVDLTTTPRLLAIERACAELPAFVAAHPDYQPDAE